MRNAFASEITEIARQREDVVLLSGDIGNKLFDRYKEIAPRRFFNCGVAEGNMIGVAAGMAMCGLKPVAYTITPFITSRCLEQIKLDLCYHNVPVIIVGTGSGLSYASLGATHHSCEDIAILRVLPHMTIICPGDAHEVRLALRKALELNGPVYIRIGKKGEPLVHEAEPAFEIGKGIVVRESNKQKDVCILSTGNMLPTAIECANELQAKSISAKVVSFHTVKPLDDQLLSDAFSQYKIVATIEEHSEIGGFGSAVSEWQVRRISNNASKFDGSEATLLPFATADEFLHEAGNQQHARQHFGLTQKHIVQRILDTLTASRIKK